MELVVYTAYSQMTMLLLTGVIVGLVIGSFLNVVIYRLPMQLQSAWRRESLDFLGLAPEEDTPRVNLLFPASRCPNCHSPVKAWQNIPIVSYLVLGGKCGHCRAPISLQYPLVELACGLLSGWILYHFGLNSTAALVLVYTWILLALTGIDVNHQLLPDNLTLPLLWLGLLVNTQGIFTDLTSAVIGAAAGYLTLWLVFWLFKLLTGKEGMGHGDFKLLAAMGAWLGWQMLPMIIIISSLVGAVIGIAGVLIFGRDRQVPIPFGPFLAIAGWIALIWGQQINSAYLRLFL